MSWKGRIIVVALLGAAVLPVPGQGKVEEMVEIEFGIERSFPNAKPVSPDSGGGAFFDPDPGCRLLDFDGDGVEDQAIWGDPHVQDLGGPATLRITSGADPSRVWQIAIAIPPINDFPTNLLPELVGFVALKRQVHARSPKQILLALPQEAVQSRAGGNMKHEVREHLLMTDRGELIHDFQSVLLLGIADVDGDRRQEIGVWDPALNEVQVWGFRTLAP